MLVVCLTAGAIACGGLIEVEAGDAGAAPSFPPEAVGPSSSPGAAPRDGGGRSVDATVDATTPDATVDAATMDAAVDAGVPGELILATALPSFLAADATNVYWTDLSGGIVQADKHGGGLVTLASSGAPCGIAVDATSVYWADQGYGGTIRKVPIGGGTASIIASNQSFPVDLVVDAGSVYWTTGSSMVMKSNVDGSNVRAVATNQDHPEGIAVHGDVLCWSNHNWSSTVTCAGLEGENAHVLYTGGLIWGVATDGAEVFFLDNVGSTAHVHSIGVSGSPPSQILASGPGGEFRGTIAFDDQYLWFTWAGGDGLVKLARTGGAPQAWASLALDLFVDDTDVSWITYSTGGPREVRTRAK